jgi:hypothetical protein
MVVLQFHIQEPYCLHIKSYPHHTAASPHFVFLVYIYVDISREQVLKFVQNELHWVSHRWLQNRQLSHLHANKTE